MSIKRIQIEWGESRYYPLFEELYMSSFPENERRNPDSLPEIFSNEAYHPEAWVKGDTLLALLCWWEDEAYRYIEHYAIHPEHRSSGFGSRFLKEWRDEDERPVILEIEPVVDDLTTRRLAFYRRLSFVENKEIEHIQPPYHKGTPPVPFEILSYPVVLSTGLYLRFKATQASVYMPDFSHD